MKATWKNPGGPPSLPESGAVDEITVKIELITPMLGGGVVPRERDPEGWLRSASVKGQLRFWWRALYAQRYASVEALRQAEGKLFGLPGTFDEAGNVIGGPGVVSIAVRSVKEPTTKSYPLKLGDIAKEYGNKGYLLFPAQKGNNPGPAQVAQPGAQALLTIAFRSASSGQRAEVVDALSAWLTLGGIGSRTRRGIGAIACYGSTPKIDLPTTFEQLKRYVAARCVPEPARHDNRVFYLAGRTYRALVGKLQANALDALEVIAKAWKDARQYRSKPLNGARYGRSTWPEADTIRRATDRAAKWADGTEHSPTQSDGAPRARLGLPIGVQFIDANKPSPNDHAGQDKLRSRGGDMSAFDPDKTEIKHEKGDRFASPVLFCVARVHEGFVPIVLATLPTLPYRAKIESKLIEASMSDEAILDRVLKPFGDFQKVFPR